MSMSKENGYSQEDEESDSTWMFNVLDTKGANNSFRKICQETAITNEIIATFATDTSFSIYSVGSRSEGTFNRDKESDQDIIQCVEIYPVIEDILEAEEDKICLLIVRESETPGGYVKLQLVVKGVPYTDKHWSEVSSERCFKRDSFGRILLSDLMNEAVERFPFISRPKNKPAAKVIENYCNVSTDTVVCYRCKKWPTVANEWLSRHRSNRWPTEETIDDLKSLGYFVVRKGHPLSPEVDLEWRISLSLQERILIFNLTDVQYKCYYALKMINRDLLQLECITTYHWKTCLFYMIEENEQIIWGKKHMFHCVKLCIIKMLEWIKKDCCPNYFIPSENMFRIRFSPKWKVESIKKLENILNDGYAFMFPGRLKNAYDLNRLQEHVILFGAERNKAYRNAYFTYILKAETTRLVMHGVSFILFEYTSKVNTTHSNVINSLWQTLDRIHNEERLCDHTVQETQRALSLLQHVFYTCVASNISAMCIQLNHEARDFLLFGSYINFMKGELPGSLKFISVLYAAGFYKECEWYLDQLDEEYIKNNPSVCFCHSIPNVVVDPMSNDVTEILHLKMSTCVLFLPTELQIIPDALKFELFRYIGIQSYESDREEFFWRWHYWAVVDSNIYYFVLKFLTYRKVKEVKLSLDVLDCIKNLLSGSNVVHRDVAYNLLAWCYCSVGAIPDGLDMLRMSWKEKHPPDSLFVYFNKELIQKHYQFNSAKLHALVIWYNIWFTRKQLHFQFCFQCLVQTVDALKKCSSCKIATYCSTKCQRKNWRIHKAYCNIVKMYHNA